MCAHIASLGRGCCFSDGNEAVILYTNCTPSNLDGDSAVYRNRHILTRLPNSRAGFLLAGCPGEGLHFGVYAFPFALCAFEGSAISRIVLHLSLGKSWLERLKSWLERLKSWLERVVWEEGTASEQLLVCEASLAHLATTGVPSRVICSLCSRLGHWKW